MKKGLFSFFALAVLIAGCNQGTSPEDIAKMAYEWEKAKFDNDYDTQQEFLYQEGSYEVDKGTKKVDSNLKYEDVRLEVFFDEESEQYYVFADFKNPNGENLVKDNILLRQKADMWKVDTSKSLDVNRDEVKEKFEREACINCK
ncbi:hypothetical protein [Metabacillus idriensis]|uniref:hypothetical protein n=1 Tax=Metabacillus idriensis TaxID=324768 RepID=UPI001749FAC2|nr:hypothetical protein [Metabacillus idriensis]